MKDKKGRFIKDPNKKKVTKKERKKRKADATKLRKAAKKSKEQYSDLTLHDGWLENNLKLLNEDRKPKTKLYTIGRDKTSYYDDRIRTVLSIMSEFTDLLGMKLDYQEMTDGQFTDDDGTIYISFNQLNMAHYFDSIIQMGIDLSHDPRTYIRDFYPKLEEYRALYDGSSRIDKVAFVASIINIIN